MYRRHDNVVYTIPAGYRDLAFLTLLPFYLFWLFCRFYWRWPWQLKIAFFGFLGIIAVQQSIASRLVEMSLEDLNTFVGIHQRLPNDEEKLQIADENWKEFWSDVF